MQIIKVATTETKKIIKTACKVLLSGGLIIYPTETCYGVGVDVTNQEAVNKLLTYKKRPEGKAISIALCCIEMAGKYVELNDTAKNIYREFLPGPVTVISNSKNMVALGISAEDNTLGIRIPKYDLVLDIIKTFNKPISATSANSSGEKTPYQISDILKNLNGNQKILIDLVIDAGKLKHKPPSTVIDTTKEQMKVLRRGDVFPGKLILEEVIESEEQMQLVAKEFLLRYKKILRDNTILILFNAELGAGKTQFVKGLSRGLGINSNVNSPTFVLIKEYSFNKFGVKGDLVHIDAWRMESIEELKKLELHTYIQKGNIIALEWAGMALEYLSKVGDIIKVYVEIEYLELNKRLLKIYEYA